jgi:hypothetical protein
VTDTETPAPAPGDILKKLAKDPQFIRTRDGVESFGLYFEFVEYSKYSGHMLEHIRMFLFENSLSAYSRVQGKKSGRWQVAYYDSYDTALSKTLSTVQSRTERFGRKILLRGTPLILQAAVSDIVAVRNSEKHGPDCRWRGINAIDSKYGKVSDDDRIEAEEAS